MKPRTALVVSAAALALASSFSSLAFAAPEDLVVAMGRRLTPERAARMPAPVIAGPDWGTSGTSSYMLGPCDASSRDDTLTFSAIDCDDVRPIGAPGTDIAFPVHLPAGALVVSATLFYVDNVDTEPSIGMYATPPGQLGDGVMNLTPPTFNGGSNVVTFIADPPFTVDNAKAYVILALLSPGHAIQGIRLDYKLQVSAAPGSPTFLDVPTNHPFFQFIEALAASGITGGCGSGNYCPDNFVTRGQMAVFLSKALGLSFPN
ncbi:MAG TPA: S-layer homology domain-containing protein [Thermoanaerobaculia bacterium]|nr:S-layer homology domain-containing protein [Thermoanaerobaculia bacterium]